MMSDARLANQPVNLQLRLSNNHIGVDGISNEAFIQQSQAGMLVASNGDGQQSYLSSEELKMSAMNAVRENEQLKAQIVILNNSMKQNGDKLNGMKEQNATLTQGYKKLHEQSVTRVLSLKNKIKECQRQNEEIRKQNEDLKHHLSKSKPTLPDSVIKHTFEGLRQTVGNGSGSLTPGDKEGSIIEKLQRHIERAEEILLQQLCGREAELAQRQGVAGDGEGGSKVKVTLPVGQETPKGTKAGPLSPTGQQQAYNESMQNMIGQLDSFRKQVEEKSAKLNEERERVQELESNLEKARSRINALQSTQDRHVAAAVERQREEDDLQHQVEMKEMMARLDELTLLAADRHQKHAFDEEPRYHSASNELKQQVTSLVAELELKERCLEEERQQFHQQVQLNEALQVKVGMYHEELQKSRQETKNYIDTLNMELKRKENMYQAERQKALHERIQSDKCKEELEVLQAKVDQLHKANTTLKLEKKEIQEKEDRLVAEVLSAEEAIEAKDHEARKFELEVKKLKDSVEIWRTQTDVCQRDFQEERSAREKMHREKMLMKAKLEDMQREKEKLEEELQVFHRQQLQQVQDRYRPAYGGFDRGGGTELYAPRRQVYDVVGEPMDEAGPTYGPYNIRQPQQEQTQHNWCPKCQQTFPDFDTLQIHITDCID